MADDNSAPNEGALDASTPSSTDQSASAGSNQPRAADGRFEPSQWRYPADYPVEFLRGRTADEAAQLQQQMYQAMLSGGPVPGQQQYQQQPFGGQQVSPQNQYYGNLPQQPTQPAQPAPPTAEDWQLDPAAAYQRQAAYDRATQYDPIIQQQQATTGQMSRELVSLKYQDEFRRWGPEIDLLMQEVPLHQRSVQAYNMAVDVVRGRHAREITQEQIDKALEGRIQSGDVVRPDATQVAGTSPVDDGRLNLEDESLPKWWREWCVNNKVTPRDMDTFLMDTKFYGNDLNKARKTYMEVVKRDGAIEGATDGQK